MLAAAAANASTTYWVESHGWHQRDRGELRNSQVPSGPPAQGDVSLIKKGPLRRHTDVKTEPQLNAPSSHFDSNTAENEAPILWPLDVKSQLA